MYSLKMLGLTVLAGLCLVIFFAGYDYFQGVSASQSAREEASRLRGKINHVIITGDNRRIDVEVPGGYTLRFESNQVIIDGTRLPEDGFDIPVEGPDLGPGEYSLIITIEDGRIKVSEVS